MPVWSIEPIEERPCVTLISWRVYEVPLNGNDQPWTRHFAGWSCEDKQGQVSSAVVSFDPQAQRGITSSGRVYELRGSPGFNADADYTWSRWKRINNVTEERVVAIQSLRA